MNRLKEINKCHNNWTYCGLKFDHSKHPITVYKSSTSGHEGLPKSQIHKYAKCRVREDLFDIAMEVRETSGKAFEARVAKMWEVNDKIYVSAGVDPNRNTKNLLQRFFETRTRNFSCFENFKDESESGGE